MRINQFILDANERLEIGVSGNYVRVTESLATLVIEHPQAGEKVEVVQGDDVELSPFSSLYVTNTSEQQITIKLTIATDKKAGSAKVGGDVQIAGDVGLKVTTLQTLIDGIDSANVHYFTNSYYSAGAYSAGAIQLLSPSDNVNGVLIMQSSAMFYASATPAFTVVAKETAPTAIGDGDVLYAFQTGVASTVTTGRLDNMIKVESGMGLYVFVGYGGSQSSVHCLYKLL